MLDQLNNTNGIPKMILHAKALRIKHDITFGTNIVLEYDIFMHTLVILFIRAQSKNNDISETF